MKRTALVIAAAVLAAPLLCCSRQEEPPPEKPLTSSAEKLGYALGMEVGGALRSIGTQVDLGAFRQGVEDSFTGAEPALTPQEASELKAAFAQKRQEEMARRMKELADKNLAEGEAFLKANKKREGVITTASGLQYSVLKEGEGAQPTAEDRVMVHFTGALLDGTLFQDTRAAGKAATLSLKSTIPGLNEGLRLMRVGGRYRFYVPSELAFGKNSPGPRIGPNSTVVFEVELLAVNPPEEQPQPEGKQPPEEGEAVPGQPPEPQPEQPPPYGGPQE